MSVVDRAGPPKRASRASHHPVRDLEVSELRAFCAAATLGSIAEAARSMRISQPAMSKRLRTLETVAGAELFQRSSRGVTLTPAGVELYEVARRLLRNADSVQALIKSPVSAPPVRIAASPLIAELRLPQVLGSLGVGERHLTAELISANSSVVRELVHAGGADLGIAGLDPYEFRKEDLEERVIWRDELVLAVPHSHPWAQLDEVPAEEFAATTLLQRDPWSNSSRVVTTALDRLGLERAEPRAVIGSDAAVLAAARAGGVPALVSLMALQANPEAGVAVGRVEGLRFGLEYGLVWVGSMHDLRTEVQLVANHILQLPYARSSVV